MLGERTWQSITLAPEGPARPQKALHTPWASVTSKATQISVWHHVQRMLVLLPTGTIYRGTHKHSSIGEVQSAYVSILAQASASGNGGRPFIPMPEGTSLLAAER